MRVKSWGKSSCKHILSCEVSGHGAVKPLVHSRHELIDPQKSLCSSVMSFSGSRPTQARKMLVRAARCLARALTTGVPGGVRGA